MSGVLQSFDLAARDRLRPEPMPSGLEPMLATLSHEHFDDPDWIYERKLDGVRLLLFVGDGGVRLMTRNGKRAEATYPEIVEVVERLELPDAVLDGEVVAFEDGVTSFSRLQRRMQLQDADRARASGVEITFYVFDLLHLAGYSTRTLPLRERKQLLRSLLSFEEPLRYSQHRNRDGTAFLEEACDKRWEGLIAKRAASPYRTGRSRDWLKFRCSARQEFVIGGYTDPKGQRTAFGALLIGYHDEHGALRYAGRVGTGYDERTLRDLGGRLSGSERRRSPFADDVPGRDVHFVEPELVAEVAFTEWTHDARLRHPRFLGLRHDKSPNEVVREDADGSATR